MDQYLNKRVEYTGEDSKDLGLRKGKQYSVTHTYGESVGVFIGLVRGSRVISSASYTKFEIVKSSSSDLNVHSILVYEDEPVGIRIVDTSQFFDIGVDSIKGLTKRHLRGFKTDTLVLDNDLLVTNEELTTGMTVYDKSGDKKFCKVVEVLFSL